LDASEAAAATISGFRDYLETKKRGEEIGYADWPDRRKDRDLSCEIACWTISDSGEEHGRSHSFSTDPVTSKRGGGLFAYINSISRPRPLIIMLVR